MRTINKRTVHSLRAGTLFMLLLLLAPRFAYAQAELDTDHDGISDMQEQLLLEKFRPNFMVSASDCAILPAKFEPYRMEPKALVANGTVYGQVFPAMDLGKVEVHYYVLWERDCGRIRHPLDVEHVSALITSSDVRIAKALYWYSGAHERTACDISSGSRATTVNAEDRGPVVWSSSGKHALYLRKKMCGHGCGADACDDDVPMASTASVINVGELGAPANGAVWIGSLQWRFAEKMDSDFPPVVLGHIDSAPADTVVTLGGNSTIRGTIQGSDLVLGSAALGTRHTGNALDTANDHTSRSLDTATRATGGALKRAWNFIFRSSPSKPASELK